MPIIRSWLPTSTKYIEDLVPKRGEIFAKDGSGSYPVAVNRELSLVYAVPKEVEDPKAEAHELAVILQLDERDLEAKLDQPDGWYAVIQHKVEDDKAEEIKSKKLKGIYMSPESERFYPAGNFASQVVGFVGSDGEKTVGRYGLESYWNKELEGTPGSLEQERDTGGRWISIGEKKIVPAQNGADLYLTIDHTIQYRAEMAIKKAVEKYQADRGSIVIIDPATGGVLAMASAPDFNPNDYSKIEDISVFANPAVSDNYECGSIFKSITLASGVDAKVVTPDTTYTDTGAVNEAGYTIQNSDHESERRANNDTGSGKIFEHRSDLCRKTSWEFEIFGIREKFRIWEQNGNRHNWRSEREYFRTQGNEKHQCVHGCFRPGTFRHADPVCQRHRGDCQRRRADEAVFGGKSGLSRRARRRYPAPSCQASDFQRSES